MGLDACTTRYKEVVLLEAWPYRRRCGLVRGCASLWGHTAFEVSYAQATPSVEHGLLPLLLQHHVYLHVDMFPAREIMDLPLNTKSAAMICFAL